MRALSAAFAALLTLSPAVAAQTTWYVDVSGTPPGSGTLADPYTSLQYAIDQVTTLPGDSIVVAPGVYAERIDYKGKALAISSSGGSAVTTIDAGGVGSAVTIATGEGTGTSLVGFTVTGGTGTGIGLELHGGGLRCVGTVVDLADCRFVNDTADVGGAIHAQNADLELEGCVIEDITLGGGIHAESMVRLALSGCTLLRVDSSGCSSSGCSLGALTARLSSVEIESCVFESNRAFGSVDPDAASAATLVDCSTTIDGSLFHRNGNHDGAIDQAGAVAAIGGDLVVRTSAFTQNRNEFRGGALVLRGTTAQLEDCELSDNWSFDDYWGGAIYMSPAAPSTLTVLRSTFDRNFGGDGGAAYVGAGSAFFGECTFRDNVAHGLYYELGSGGALFVEPAATLEAERCQFAGNEAHGNDFQTPTGGRGGAVFGVATIDRCTFSGNVAVHDFLPSAAGAVYDGHLDSSIAWHDSPNELGGAATAEWSDVQGGYPGTGNIDADPRFWSEASRDHHLLPGSPCIDTGNPSAPLDPDGSPADMGALPLDLEHCGAPTSYCFAKPNSQNCLPAIGSIGTPAIEGPNDFHVTATEVLNKQNGILIWSHSQAAIPFFGGLLCLGPPIVRTGLQNSGGSPMGSDCTGTFDFHFSQEYMEIKDVTAFETVYAQYWYRDPMGSFGVGLTDALRFVVCATAGD